MAIAFVSAIEKDTTTIPANGTQTAVTGSFTPAAGELLVCKVTTSAETVTITSVTSSPALTWTQRAANTVTTGTCNSYIYTATVGTSAATTVSVAFNNTDTVLDGATIVVERFTGATLAGSPATHTLTGSSTVSDTITSTVANSVISWVSGDYSGITGTATYRSSAVQTGLFQSSGALCAYTAYQAAAAAGSQTYGMTAPTGQKATMAALEIIPSVATFTPRSGLNVRQAVNRASIY